MKLKDLLSENVKIGSGKYANIYDMKKEMKEGKFDPKNPTIAVTGLGVYSLKLLEKRIQKDLIGAAKNLGTERGIETLMYHLYQSQPKSWKELREEMRARVLDKFQIEKQVTLYSNLWRGK